MAKLYTRMQFSGNKIVLLLCSRELRIGRTIARWLLTDKDSVAQVDEQRVEMINSFTACG